jgi:hypothetical protein
VAHSNKSKLISSDASLLLVVLDTPNLEPSSSGEFELKNKGSLPKIGTIYIDCNPGEMSKPIKYLFVQTEEAQRPSRKTSTDRCYVYCESIPIPTPRSFREILDKLNDGQFLKLAPVDDFCTVPRSRRAVILKYLGFKAE